MVGGWGVCKRYMKTSFVIQIYFLQFDGFSQFTLLPKSIGSLSYSGLFQKTETRELDSITNVIDAPKEG